MLAINAEATVVYVNSAAESQGWDRDAWIGKNALDLIHPEDLPLALSSIVTVQEKSVGTLIEMRVAHPTEGWRLFEVIGSNQLDNPDLGVIVLSCRDLSERRRWEVAQGNVARFQAVVHNAASITMLVGADGRIQSVSGAITRLLGYDPEHLAGSPFSSLAAPGHSRALDDALRRRSPGNLTTVEVPIRPAAGSPTRPYRFEIVDMCADSVVNGFVVTGHDITELHVAREALEHLATHDALTGLPNRIALTDRVSEALARRTINGLVALLFVDLDRFKPVNDLLGHDAGDELLVAVAQRLTNLVRSTDTVARIGGDEFVVLSTGMMSRHASEELAHRVERALAEPFMLRAGVAHITASVGLAVADHTSSVSALLADADQAMYQLKTARRNGVLNRARGANERRELASSLVGAVERGEIVAYMQPIVNTVGRRLVGFETLVRWHHPAGKVLGPGDFLDVAQEIGMSSAIDLAMADRACRVVAGLAESDPGLWVSVNMTAADLADPHLVASITEILERHRLDPRLLIVEVTEQATLERQGLGEQTSPQTTLRELAHLGVRIALDDFGTGYSSLTHLRRLKVDALKIDRSFVEGVTTDPTDRSLVAAIIGLAHALDLRTVAEGVEREDQAATLQVLGCDTLQGYLIAEPLHPNDVPDWVSARRTGRSLVAAANPYRRR